jgi:3-oxoacyl-[acyl-carrier-protein] synthase-3
VQVWWRFSGLTTCYQRAEPERESILLVTADNYGGPLVARWRIAAAMIAGDAAAVVITTSPASRDCSRFPRWRRPRGEELHRSG